MYNNLLKRILFPSLSIYFFPIFSLFSIPKSKIWRIMGKNGNFFYFENRNFVSLSFHILFSPFLPIFAHPQIQASVCLREQWGWTLSPPPYIDQICVEVFEKTIRRTEIIDHLFERKFYGAYNRLYKDVLRGFSRAYRPHKVIKIGLLL